MIIFNKRGESLPSPSYKLPPVSRVGALGPAVRAGAGEHPGVLGGSGLPVPSSWAWGCHTGTPGEMGTPLQRVSQWRWLVPEPRDPSASVQMNSDGAESEICGKHKVGSVPEDFP